MSITNLLTPQAFAFFKPSKQPLNVGNFGENKNVFEKIKDKGGLREYARQIQADKIREEIEKRILEQNNLSKEEYSELKEENPALYQKIEAEVANLTEIAVQELLEKAAAASSPHGEKAEVTRSDPLPGGLNKNGTGQIINVLV